MKTQQPMQKRGWCASWKHEDQCKEESDYSLKIWKPTQRGEWVQLENKKTNMERKTTTTWEHEDQHEEEDGYSWKHEN